MGCGSNERFPAVVDESFFTALRTGGSHAGVELNETALQRLSILNPIASAVGFHTMIETVFNVLVGLPSARHKKVSKPVYDYDQKTGLYRGGKTLVGLGLAYQYVVETSGKLAMHIHGGVWGAITDRLLSKAASHKDLFEAVAKALDSQCCASLPFEVHVVHASRKVLKVRATRPALCDPPTRIDADLSPPTLDSTDTRRRIWADTKRVQLWAASLGDHTEHHATCEKGFSGRFYCRMNKPTGHGEETKPKTCVWQLVRKREAADEFIAEHLWLCRSKACNEIATCDPELSRWDPPQRTHEIYVIEPRALPLPTLDGGGTRGLVCSYAPTPFCLGTPSALTQLSLPCTCTCVCGWVGATIAGGALAPAQGHACAGRRTQTPSPRAARVSPAAAVGQLARRADDRLGDRTEDAGVSPRSNAARYGRTLVA